MICVCSWSQARLDGTGARLDIVPSRAYKPRCKCKCNSPRSDHPAHLSNSTATVRTAPWIPAACREHQCASFQPNLRLFLIIISTEAYRVSLDIAPGCACKLRCRQTSHLGDYPAPVDHHITAARTAPWPAASHRHANKAHILAKCSIHL